MLGWCRSLVAGLACVLLAAIVSCVAAAGEPAFSANTPNQYTFDAVSARFVRVVVSQTNQSSVCLDELEVYGPDSPNNLAVEPGATASASSALPGYPQHQVQHLNDGQYGNAHSWVAAEGQRRCWAQIDLGKPATVNRVVFCRDRTGRYSDRTATQFVIQTSSDATKWQTAAGFGEPLAPPEETTPEAEQLRADLLAGKLGFRDLLVIKHHPLDVSHVYVYHSERFRRGGGLYVFHPDADGGQLRCLVDSSDGMIIHADLSYDGREVLFAWKRGGEEMADPFGMTVELDRSVSKNNYQIYRINIDGTGLTQLTDGPHNNLDPCWLPDGGVAFTSDRKPAFAYCWVVTSPVLYRMDRDGKNQRRLSANYLMDFTPSVLTDGRIVYSRWEYVDRAVCPIQSLWAINPDGTALSGFYGNRVISPGTFMHARAIPGTSAILATATNHNGPCRGGILRIDPSHGANAPESVTNLTPELDYGTHQWGGGGAFGNGMLNNPQARAKMLYEKPFPIDDARYVVSKAGAVQLRDYDSNAVTLLESDDAMGFYNAIPIRTMTPPPLRTGLTMDESVALPEDGGVSGNWASVFMQNVYEGLQPHVRPGEVKRIAVVQEMEKGTHSPIRNYPPEGGDQLRIIACFGWQFPLVSCGATFAPKKVWGYADVREDGSAAFLVPSEVPIYFLALDAEGRAVQRMRSFTHFMPGEVQGCVGCHADRNHVTPGARSRLGTPGSAQALTPPQWGVTGFSYGEIVQPVLDRHCTSCHDQREQPGGVDLSGDKTDFFSVSYDVLARTGTLGARNWRQHDTISGPAGDQQRGKSPWVSWIWTINGAGHNILQVTPRTWGSPVSRLAELVETGHPDEDGQVRVSLSWDERQPVYRWIDLNVPYYGTSSSNHKQRMGSRRLQPLDLDSTLTEVASRRCDGCHQGSLPRKFYTRITNPENNSFLLAPLAEAAGGDQSCEGVVFADVTDPDYGKLADVLRQVKSDATTNPRADMLPDRPALLDPECRYVYRP